MMLLLRADANTTVGTGHVLRGLALGQAWQDQGGAVTLAGHLDNSALIERLQAEGVTVEPMTTEPGSEADAAVTADLAKRLGARWVVLDGYHFSGAYQRQLKEAGLHVLALDDDGHAEHYYADLVLNQNLHAAEELYRRREPSTRLLLGPRYVLLRREFAAYRDWQRNIVETACNVLVTLGGSDVDNVTLKVVHALGLVESVSTAVVVVGAGNPHQAALKAAAVEAGPAVQLRCNVINMAQLMTWADVAVTAAGSTTWERACLGLPGLMVVLADNQVRVAEAAAAAGLGQNLGWHSALSAESLAKSLSALLRDAAARAEQARRGREIVDGRGAERVVTQMHAAGLTLRPVRPDDCRLVWEWANEPAVRAVSFSMEPIPWERHQAWFADRLADPDCLFFVAELAGHPLGQVRIDLSDPEAMLSISLAPQARGRGHGVAMVRSACDAAFATGRTRAIVALVRDGNVPSRRMFLKAGFAPDGQVTVRGFPAERLIVRK